MVVNVSFVDCHDMGLMSVEDVVNVGYPVYEFGRSLIPQGKPESCVVCVLCEYFFSCNVGVKSHISFLW